jgi:hypothetical protein
MFLFSNLALSGPLILREHLMTNRDETPACPIKRHEEETAAAQAATDREARILHLERAMRYALQAARNDRSEPI